MIVLGLPLFTGTDNKSGVVWADVAQKVETSRGVIYHERFANNNPRAISDYVVIHLSATQYRSESYQSGKLWMTMYEDREARQRVVLLHGQKGYVKEKMTPTDKEQQRLADRMDPRK